MSSPLCRQINALSNVLKWLLSKICRSWLTEVHKYELKPYQCSVHGFSKSINFIIIIPIPGGLCHTLKSCNSLKLLSGLKQPGFKQGTNGSQTNFQPKSENLI